jgi:hypothetical protein
MKKAEALSSGNLVELKSNLSKIQTMAKDVKISELVNSDVLNSISSEAVNNALNEVNNFAKAAKETIAEELNDCHVEGWFEKLVKNLPVWVDTAVIVFEAAVKVLPVVIKFVKEMSPIVAKVISSLV